MPHEPGHTNGNGNGTSNFKIIGSGKEYTGKVIYIGSDAYTTVGGAFEGTSQKLEQINNVKSRQNNVVTNSTMALPAAQVPNPIKSQTRVKFNGEYQYADDSSNVPIGTLLHTHLDNTTMTSHSTQTPMGDTSRVVIRSNITNENTRAANVRVRRTPQNGNQTRTTTNTSRVTTGRTTPPTPRSGGGRMSGGGGY